MIILYIILIFLIVPLDDSLTIEFCICNALLSNNSIITVVAVAYQYEYCTATLRDGWMTLVCDGAGAESPQPSHHPTHTTHVPPPLFLPDWTCRWAAEGRSVPGRGVQACRQCADSRREFGEGVQALSRSQGVEVNGRGVHAFR